jgi:hypothetical protein
MTWEAMVKINGIPQRMVTEAQNYVVAKGYFETFGQVVSTIRIVNEKKN